ncbi:MAG: hypothetical protein JO072_16725 [Parafilimonas sp.]|nr:hypothetical protein [Parafilimonas sp.]
MRFRSAISLVLVLLLSCRAKDTTTEGLKGDLKKTMQDYLYQTQVNNDSSNTTYRVQDVNFFDDTIKSRYVCEFTVHLKEKSLDTTGQMKAYISKDFKKVTRLY